MEQLILPEKANIALILEPPVPAKWTTWTEWGACTPTCGPGATRLRSRTFTPGRHGGKTTPDGDLEERKDCEISICVGEKDYIPFSALNKVNSPH